MHETAQALADQVGGGGRGALLAYRLPGPPATPSIARTHTIHKVSICVYIGIYTYTQKHEQNTCVPVADLPCTSPTPARQHTWTVVKQETRLFEPSGSMHTY